MLWHVTMCLQYFFSGRTVLLTVFVRIITRGPVQYRSFKPVHNVSWFFLRFNKLNTAVVQKNVTMSSNAKYQTYKWTNFIVMYAGYTLYILDRKAFSFVAPSVMKETGMSKSDLGINFYIAVMFYIMIVIVNLYLYITRFNRKQSKYSICHKQVSRRPRVRPCSSQGPVLHRPLSYGACHPGFSLWVIQIAFFLLYNILCCK